MFNLPQRSKSGTKLNSKMFIVATTVICAIALRRDLSFVKIHITITISESPIKIVKGLEKSFPKILATICPCLGTRFKTLQNSPFTSQTAAIK